MSTSEAIKAAFFDNVENPTPAEGWYVSLYMSVPFYGGPEEGGWWGRDVHLVAYERMPTRESAEELEHAMAGSIRDFNAEEHRLYGDQCRRECDWLESRGLEDSFLPEPDGEVSYSIHLEQSVGSMESRGCRHYE